jgi:hypothetical protein
VMFYVVAERKRGERGTGQIAVLSTPETKPTRAPINACMHSDVRASRHLNKHTEDRLFSKQQRVYADSESSN